MTITEAILMAYVDGELEPGARAQVEAAMAADPDIARRIARHRAFRDRLRASFDEVMEEPVPDRLLATAAGAIRLALDHAGRTSPASRDGLYGGLVGIAAEGILLRHLHREVLRQVVDILG